MPSASAEPARQYAEVVHRVRQRGLSTEEIAAATAVQPRQVQHWAAGRHRPQGTARDRLLDLQYVVELLSDVYDAEGVELWLHARNRQLDGERPIDLLSRGRFLPVQEAVERLAGGAM